MDYRILDERKIDLRFSNYLAGAVLYQHRVVEFSDSSNPTHFGIWIFCCFPYILSVLNSQVSSLIPVRRSEREKIAVEEMRPSSIEN